MTIDKDLLVEKISLEGQWNAEYAKHGYTLNLLEIENKIKFVQKQMIFHEHDQAKREVKSPDELFAVAS